MWSEPHFYNADQSYQKAVRGLQPNETGHQSVVIIEPVSLSFVRCANIMHYFILCFHYCAIVIVL